MSKINFSKVEDAIDEGLKKLTVQELLILSGGKKDKAKNDREQIAKLIAIQTEWLHKNGHKISEILGISRKKLKEELAQAIAMTDEEWKRVLEWKEALTLKLKKIKEKTKKSDENLIESERLKHVNKRFNVREKWLPLK